MDRPALAHILAKPRPLPATPHITPFMARIRFLHSNTTPLDYMHLDTDHACPPRVLSVARMCVPSKPADRVAIKDARDELRAAVSEVRHYLSSLCIRSPSQHFKISTPHLCCAHP